MHGNVEQWMPGKQELHTNVDMKYSEVNSRKIPHNLQPRKYVASLKSQNKRKEIYVHQETYIKSTT